MTASLLVWGAGGHGRVVLDVARAAGWRVAGFVDQNPGLTGVRPDPAGPAVIGNEELIWSGAARGGSLPGGATALALGLGDNQARARVMGRLAQGYFPVLVHPAAVVSPSASLEAGTVVMPQVVVNSLARIGPGVILNSAAVVEHDVVVSAWAHISPGAVVAGGVTIGRGAWIGAGAVVLQGRAIGNDSVVGAGAVVLRDVPAGVTVVGNPARILSNSKR